MSAKITLAILCLAWFGAAELKANTTYVWTGEKDSFWTNAANWTVGGVTATKCPGVCSSEIFAADGSLLAGWEQTASLADLAEFGSVRQGCQTTVDFSGLYCVSSMTFRAGCAQMTLGRSSDDVIPLQAFGSARDKTGTFTVEAQACVPTIVAGFSIGATCRDLSTQDVTYLKVVNNAESELVFKTLGHSRNIKPSLNASGVYFTLCGTGDFRFDGPVVGVTRSGTWSLYQNIHLRFETAGKVVFSTPQFGPGGDYDAEAEKWIYGDASNVGPTRIILAGQCHRVEIREGCRVSMANQNDPRINFETYGEISGEGTLQHGIQSHRSVDGNYGAIVAFTGTRGTISCLLDVYDSYRQQHPATSYSLVFKEGTYYGGRIDIAGSSAHHGPIWFNDGPGTLGATSVAGFGDGTDVFFKSASAGGLEYLGVGDETLTKALWVTSKNSMARLGNSGSGPLTYAGVCGPADAGQTGSGLILDASTAPIVFAGEIRAVDDVRFALVKTGASILSFTSSADLSGLSSLRLSGGTLDAANLPDNKLTVPLTYDTGAVRVLVPDGCTLTLASLAQTANVTAGALDFVCGTGRVKVLGRTTESVMPTGVTVNGYPARFEADGSLNVPPPAYDIAIGARGDVIPNDAAKTVAVMTAGTTGDNTLSEDATAVKGLVQYTSTPSTLAIGEGRTLTTGLLSMYGLAGELTVGTAGDAGMIAGMNGCLAFENRQAVIPLTVNTAVAANTTVRTGDGHVGAAVLAGGSAGDLAFDFQHGTVTLKGSRPFVLNGGVVGTNGTEAAMATLVMEDVDVTLGEKPLDIGGRPVAKLNPASTSCGRLVVTNAVLRNSQPGIASYAAESTNNALCVGVWGEGVMEVHDGAVISNRLIVGGIYYNSHLSIRSHGAVLQDGGEVWALSDKDGYGSHVGATSGNGYYELAGGRFTMLGSLSVGKFGAGSFLQTGGTSVFTNNPATAAGACVYGPAANGNRGYCDMRFTGGTADFYGRISVAAGGFLCYGNLILEGDASVSVHGNPVTVTYGAEVPPSGEPSVGTVSLNGGVLQALGFETSYASETIEAKTDKRAAVGFDGGTFRTDAADTDVAHVRSLSSGATSMTNFVVYAGGATIDTDGRTGNFSSVPFRSPWGKGVVGIGTFQSLDVNRTFVAAPIVTIQGDGVGAVAVADFDSKSGRVTGVRIVAAGCGYTTAKCYFRVGLSDDVYSADCALGEVAQTGSFTKAGEGDFTLKAANSWGGDTVLKGGKLRLDAVGALPEKTHVRYVGGRLSAVTATAQPAEFTAVFDKEPSRSVTLLEYEGDIPEQLPSVTLDGVGKDWSVRLVGRSLRAVKPVGFVLTVR